MAFFPRACLAETHSTPFAPFFRLLEDLDINGRSTFLPTPTPRRQIVTPRFDVKELPDSYQLYGEFPGLDQSNITLEFTDLNTLTVRANSERHYENGAPVAIEENKKPAVEDSKAPVEQEPQADATTSSDNVETASQTSHKATVEDAEDDGFVVTGDASSSNTPAEPTPTSTPISQAVAPQPQPQEAPAPQVPQQAQHHYHTYERTVGNFYRQFNFPRHIDQEAVTASMKNGILSIVVPKKRVEKRRIAIQ